MKTPNTSRNRRYNLAYNLRKRGISCSTKKKEVYVPFNSALPKCTAWRITELQIKFHYNIQLTIEP